MPSQQERVSEEEDGVRKVKKNKKGKGKETNGLKSGKRKQKKDDLQNTYTLPEPEIETSEEKADRERVGLIYCSANAKSLTVVQ